MAINPNGFGLLDWSAVRCGSRSEWVGLLDWCAVRCNSRTGRNTSQSAPGDLKCFTGRMVVDGAGVTVGGPRRSRCRRRGSPGIP